LLADGLGEVAKLGAFAEVDHYRAVQVDLDRWVGGVDGVLGRPGGLLGEADLVVGSQASSSWIRSVTVTRSRASVSCFHQGAGIRDAGMLLG
jgi:hypothetical protein